MNRATQRQSMSAVDSTACSYGPWTVDTIKILARRYNVFHARTRCSGCGRSFDYRTGLGSIPLLCLCCRGGHVDLWEVVDDVEDALFWLQDRDREVMDWFRAYYPSRAPSRASYDRFESHDGVKPIAWDTGKSWTRDHFTRDSLTTVCGRSIPTYLRPREVSQLECGRPCLNCLAALSNGA